MASDIARSIPEQYELLKNFQDPIEFMLLYISVYEQQLRCSTKVHLCQIPYFAEFQLAFLDRTLELATEGPAGLQSLDCLENVLASFRERPFYDEEFYKCCAEILFKGLNISVDRVHAEVLGGCYDRVAALYKYLPHGIDLRRLIAQHAAEKLKDAADGEAVSAVLAALGPAVARINKLIADVRPSSMLNFQHGGSPGSLEEMDAESPDGRGSGGSPRSASLIRVELSPLIAGQERVEKYRVDDILRLLVDQYKMHLKASTPEAAYSQLMGVSESVAAIYGLEDLSGEVKEYAKLLLAGGREEGSADA